MHKHILTAQQIELLPLIKEFAQEFYFERFFNEKLFREQLAYFEDIDYREQVEFVGIDINDEEIKEFLTEVALTPF